MRQDQAANQRLASMSEADCLRRAEELEEVAGRLPTGGQRDEYLMLARHWRELGAAVKAPNLQLPQS
jgi:hypothetical protein